MDMSNANIPLEKGYKEPIILGLENNVSEAMVDEPIQESSYEDVSQPNTNSQDELAQMAREDRTFTILQRERAMNDAERARNRSAIMAGVCILGASAALYFNGQDISQILQQELNAIYSWEALGQYIQDLGPLTTVLAAGAGGFVAKYFKDSKKLKRAQGEFEDFNRALENGRTVGGDENARTR